MCLYLWPYSLHQLIIHDRLHPEVVATSTVVEGLWVFDSELFPQPSSLQYQPWAGLIYFGFSRPLSFPSLLHISFKADSSLQQATLSTWSTAVVLRLTKMLDFTTFYSRSGSSPIIILMHFGYLSYTPSTPEVHSKSSNCILCVFFDVRTIFGILTTFVQHLRHLSAGVIRTAIESLQSFSTRGAFGTLRQHS